MLDIDCPNCGGPVPFRSAALPVRVCDHCRSLVLRSAHTAETVGQVAELPFDVSPLQVGTTGEWEGMAFEIVGRMRWSWTDGAWNEWMLSLSDGTTRWLGDAMGQFMMMVEKPLKGSLAEMVQRLVNGNPVRIGETGRIDGAVYQLIDQRTVTYVSCEGELPFTVPSSWEMRNVDFRSDKGHFASFQKDGDDNRLYVGRYVDLAELKPANLRALPGWEMPVHGV